MLGKNPYIDKLVGDVTKDANRALHRPRFLCPASTTATGSAARCDQLRQRYGPRARCVAAASR
jgi:hypothetical protein